MGTDEGGIDDQVFEVWIVGHRLEDACPNALGVVQRLGLKHRRTAERKTAGASRLNDAETP